MRTFTDSEQFLAYMQARYGSANFSKWQSLRKQFYSYILYPVAGLSQINFFGNAVGNAGLNRQLTNMPKAGSFGQNHFLLKSIQAKYFIADNMLGSFNGTQATTLATEALLGIFQGGAFELIIGSRTELQLPNPFLYMPPADGRAKVYTAGVTSVTATSVTPLVTAQPYADLSTRKTSRYMVDPNILIEAEQNFECVIQYPSGAIPVTATTVVDDTRNPLYVGLELDGLIFRPQQ